jgi:hypothetical protein
MTGPSQKNLSRRDAMKILAAAAGATALANIPNKWSKPGLEVGVLPAHAQTSIIAPAIPHTLVCDPDAGIINNVEQPPITVTSRVTITPPASGIPMHYSVVLVESLPGGNIDAPNPSTGTVNTNASGVASLPVTYSNVWANATITVNWSFENASDGSGTCAQVFSTPIN